MITCTLPFLVETTIGLLPLTLEKAISTYTFILEECPWQGKKAEIKQCKARTIKGIKGKMAMKL